MLITGFARTTAEVSAALNFSPMGAASWWPRLKRWIPGCPRWPRYWPGAEPIGAPWRSSSPAPIWSTPRWSVSWMRSWLGGSGAGSAGRGGASSTPWMPRFRRSTPRRPRSGAKRRHRAPYQCHRTARRDGPGPREPHGPGGALFDPPLALMATSACAKDSRTIAQRRSDAVAALSERRELACDCGRPDCPARARDARTRPAGGCARCST